jgi:hypothetical protein
LDNLLRFIERRISDLLIKTVGLGFTGEVIVDISMDSILLIY